MNLRISLVEDSGKPIRELTAVCEDSPKNIVLVLTLMSTILLNELSNIRDDDLASQLYAVVSTLMCLSSTAIASTKGD